MLDRRADFNDAAQEEPKLRPLVIYHKWADAYLSEPEGAFLYPEYEEDEGP